MAREVEVHIFKHGNIADEVLVVNHIRSIKILLVNELYNS